MKRKTEPRSSILPTAKTSKRLERTVFKRELTSLVKYGCITEIFSTAIEQTKFGLGLLTSSLKTLHPVEIGFSFFEKNEAAVFPPDKKRSKWEISLTNGYENDDQLALKKTILNLAALPVQFDDILYRVYTRKISQVSLDEAKRLFFAKLKQIDGIMMKASDGGELSFDISIYVMMKRRPDLKFNPIMSLCAALTPNVKLGADAKIDVFIEAAMEEEIKFVIKHGDTYVKNLEGFHEFIRTAEDIQPLENIMLFILEKYLIQPLNEERGFHTSRCVNPRYVKKSGIVTAYLLSVPFSKVTPDPLGSFLSTDHVDSEVEMTARLIMKLLGQTGPVLSDSDSWFPRGFMIDKTTETKKISSENYTGYFVRQTKVGLFNHEVTKESTEEYLRTEEIEHDYGLFGLRWSIAWNFLLHPLVTSQELLFQQYHQSLSALTESGRSRTRRLKELTEQAISDFEEYYDVDILSHKFTLLKREFEIFKEINSVDSYYRALMEKLVLLNAQIADEQRKIGERGLKIAIISLAFLVLIDTINFLISVKLLKI